MKVIKNKFKDLLIIQGQLHEDKRGYLREVYLKKLIKKKFKFQIISKSKKDVLRGLHAQAINPQGKYLSVIKGKIFDVVVDLRQDSKTFQLHEKFFLSEKNKNQLFIPKGFAHGFLVLSDYAVYHYKQTNYYSGKDKQFTINYKDPYFKIKLKKKKIITSERDKDADFIKI